MQFCSLTCCQPDRKRHSRCPKFFMSNQGRPLGGIGGGVEFHTVTSQSAETWRNGRISSSDPNHVEFRRIWIASDILTRPDDDLPDAVSEKVFGRMRRDRCHSFGADKPDLSSFSHEKPIHGGVFTSNFWACNWNFGFFANTFKKSAEGKAL